MQDALRTITGLMAKYGTTTFTPEMSKIFLSNFSSLGAKIIPIAKEFGMEIPESIMREILANTPDVVNALGELGYSMELEGTQQMLDVVSAMITQLSTGRIQLPAEVSSWRSYITDAITRLKLGLEPSAVQAMVDVIMLMQGAWNNTGLYLNDKSASAAVHIQETVYIKTNVIRQNAASLGMSTSEYQKYLDVNMEYDRKYANNTKNVFTYATGGMGIPRGDIFVANEDGAELVGRIGSRTAVANQEQIGDAIFRYMDEHGGESDGGLTRDDLAYAIEAAAARLVGSMAIYVGEERLGYLSAKGINKAQERAGEVLLNL